MLSPPRRSVPTRHRGDSDFLQGEIRFLIDRVKAKQLFTMTMGCLSGEDIFFEVA